MATDRSNEQQAADSRDEMDPYPQDQAFGAAAARDIEAVDRGEVPSTAMEGDEAVRAGEDGTPRAYSKAKPEGEGDS